MSLRPNSPEIKHICIQIDDKNIKRGRETERQTQAVRETVRKRDRQKRDREIKTIKKDRARDRETCSDRKIKDRD